MVTREVPEHLRSENGPEFAAADLRKWLADTGAKTLHRAGIPCENGYCESFNSKLRDEFLNGEIFFSIKKLRMLAARWRLHYNNIPAHSSLGYRPPAPQRGWPPACLRLHRTKKHSAATSSQDCVLDSRPGLLTLHDHGFGPQRIFGPGSVIKAHLLGSATGKPQSDHSRCDSRPATCGDWLCDVDAA